jgi:cytochrome c biogenesis protein CcdA
LIAYGSPLIGFFRNERLIAISIGITNYKTLDQVLMVDDENIKVFTPYYVYSLNNARIQFQEFFLEQEGNKKTEIYIQNLVFPITLLALADSVNPCTFALFTALLFITLHSLGEMRAAATGFSFILAIFIGYYVLGLGAFSILVAIPHIDKVLAILGLLMGGFNIIRGLKVEFKSSVSKHFGRFMESRIKKSYASSIFSFFLGLIATFTLLPCSGGPYIVGLGLLSTLKDSSQIYLLLTLYNLIFVMPLILILTIVLASSRISFKIKVLRSTKLGIMELVNGALLIIVCIYLLAS